MAVAPNLLLLNICGCDFFVIHQFITTKTAFHHCTFQFITAHFMNHCTLKQALAHSIRRGHFWSAKYLQMRKPALSLPASVSILLYMCIYIIHTHTHTHIYIYIYIYIRICMYLSILLSCLCHFYSQLL